MRNFRGLFLRKKLLMTVPKLLPSYEYLNKRFFYETSTGKLFWRYCNHMPKQWNSSFAGKEAGCIAKSGYVLVSVNNSLLFAHRVVWKLHTRNDPDGILDHINGVKNDNKINNLRIATYAQNQQNKSVSNVHGKGVSYDSKRKKYQVQIRVNGVNVHLGRFNQVQDAKDAYRNAAIDNFREFARYD